MKNIIKVIVVIFILFFLPQNGKGQHKIVFNENGQLLSNPPNIIAQDESIQFSVQVSKEYMDSRIFKIFEQYSLALNRLNRKDSNKNQILARSGIVGTEAERIRKRISYEIAIKIDSLLNADFTKETLESKFDIDYEKEKIKSYKDDTTFKAISKSNPIIPSINNLILPEFAVDYQLFNLDGHLITPNNVKDCDNEPIKLKGRLDCNLRFESDENYLGSDESFKLIFNLREVNKEYLALENQLKTNPIDPLFNSEEDIINGIARQINDSLITPQIINNLLEWYELKEGNEKKYDFQNNKPNLLNKSQSLILKNWVLESEAQNTIISERLKKKFNNTLNKTQRLFFDQWTASKQKEIDLKINLNESLKDDPQMQKLQNAIIELRNSTINYLVQFIWLNNSQVSIEKDILTSNPLAFSNTETLENDILNDDNKLLELRKLSEEINKKIEYFRGLNQSQNICCATPIFKGNLKTLQNEYNELLKSYKVNENDIGATQKKLEANKKILSSIKIEDIRFRQRILKDSLLYKGELYINSDDLSSTVYMRHHDALKDYHLMGLEPIKEINEDENLFILIENSKLNQNLILKTTVTLIQKDYDLPSQEFSALSSNLSYESLALNLKRLLILFKNKTLSLPLKNHEDNSPNYLTRRINHKLPEEAPSTVKYEILDSLNKQNVNTESSSFNYRFNKLYRFRLKAGLVYSFLERRDYTINATSNTASLSTEKAGLGGAFGLQIFPKRIDIRGSGFVMKPFIYTGFIFTQTFIENFLIGGGVEIVNGLAIMGGWHIGQTEFLTTNGGTLTVKPKHLVANGFISVGVSIPIFDKLFNINNLSNPFKKI